MSDHPAPDAPAAPDAPDAPAAAPDAAAADAAAADAPATPAATPAALKRDLANLDALERRLFAHRHAVVTIQFAGETTDPEEATAPRAEALATLEEEAHELLASDHTLALLLRLRQAEDQGRLDPMHLAQTRLLERTCRKATQVPAEVEADFARLTCESQSVWTRAKRANDWTSFEPWLDRVIAALRQRAELRRPGQDPYDTLLDEYERGTTRAFYDAFFSEVKACVVPLVAAIAEKGWQPRRSCVEGRFAHDAQMALARDLLAAEGLRAGALTLSETEHPFSDSVSSRHAYIATHVYENDVLSNVFSTLHEGGHALYEQSIEAAFDGTSLNGGVSSGVHESQSRFFENYVGRSRAFAPVLLGLLNRHFPGRFDGVDTEALYLAENRAQPGLVRTEADELTYPLHILIRYEIEQLLMAGEATARDVPGLWAEKYRSYLGLDDVPDDTRGALQDVHWSAGLVGYFPTYALGGAYGAQLLDAMRAGVPSAGASADATGPGVGTAGSGPLPLPGPSAPVDFERVCATGDLSPVRDWLRERVWRYGKTVDPAELIANACGAPFDPKHYTRYLTSKFSAIYNL